MEGSDGSPPPSLCMIRAAELFPKPSIEKEDNVLTVSFQELAGESVKYLGRTDDGVLALSNYRLFFFKNSTCSETSVPLGLIESPQIRDLFHLLINCKDASTVKCSFETAEQCTEWQRRITLSVGIPESLECLFAFPFYSWTSDMATAALSSTATSNNILNGGPVTLNAIDIGSNGDWSGRLQRVGKYEDDFRKECERLQFDLNGAWRISHANADFKLCPSYPQQILVPCCISDETLNNVANFRGSRRLPAVVWRHKPSGAVIARCSQPEVGWLGWRNSKDEQLLKALADACAFDRGEQTRRQNLCTSGESSPSSPDGSHEEVIMDEVRKILIVDARSYTSAVTNRARGGGCECIEYYPCAEIEFMNLGNIHAIRKSFHSLRQLCASPADVPNWLGLLERTMWLQHLSGLVAASMTVCHAIEKKGRPVLVHCSDGWDRTPQIVATAQLCLDGYYRTVEGFRVLVEREWLHFGHKFADRCGHGPGSDELNERCPVFIQWLDLVHQIHKQFPCSFEFSMAYLIKLAQHSHSCLFGTFLCNTLKERIENSVFERTFSVWPFLSGPIYKNALYLPNKEKVLWPAHNVRDLSLWTEVYLGSLGNQNATDFPPCTTDTNQGSSSPMTKTRSYGDLMTAGGTINGLTRRSSDPNMTVDTHIMLGMNNSENNSVVDLSSNDHETSSDVITNIIHDTTEKLQNLTHELNQSDEEICKINSINLITKQNCTAVSHPEILETDPKIQDDGGGGNIVTTQSDSENEEHFKTNNDSFINNGDNGVYNNKNGIETCFNNGAQSINNIPSLDEIDSKESLTATTGNSFENHINNSDINDSNMMESVDLRDTSDLQNPWHGSVNTSTDTLVPIENQSTNNENNFDENNFQEKIDNSTNGINEIITDPQKSSKQRKFSNNIYPEVHGKQTVSTNGVKNSTNSMDESIFIMPEHQKLEISSSGKCETLVSSIINTTSSHRRRRTSSSNSRNEAISTKTTNGSVFSSTNNSRFSTPGIRSLPLTPPSLTERGTSVSISCGDGLAHALSEQNIRLQQIVYEHKLREDALLREIHGMRMALLKKSCPNCNNTASDEQVDVMLNEEICDYCYSTRNLGHGDHLIFGSRPELVNSALDNIENLSVCSWEAVEDRSGPSSGASSTQPCGNVLWVPDHAVSKCTGCQTEFWLGRRKHHCRSCGQIFCADCSEFWAPLPDERLYNPVRLCGPCYHAVTTKIQQTQIRAANNATIANIINQSQMTSNGTAANSATSFSNSNTPSFLNNNCSAVNASVSSISTSSTNLDGCKRAASPTRNDCGQLKATAASN